MTPKEFSDMVNASADMDYGICPPPITAEKAMSVLMDHFLGKDWYTVLPLNQEQVYTEAVYTILTQSQNKISPFSWFKRK